METTTLNWLSMILVLLAGAFAVTGSYTDQTLLIFLSVPLYLLGLVFLAAHATAVLSRSFQEVDFRRLIETSSMDQFE